ncbi:MAG: sigma-70 family RNA polymerase sigma factor [Myxococcota bacterium]|jgi:RNA polymerase sigma-70 factor (ECF subfamily)|nr:sigma-70 family RNA polymerase sigma factor [Myxococcota bacterium]
MSTQLLDRCTRGEREAFAELVRQYSALVYFAIYHTLRRKGLILQEDQVAELHNALFLSLLEDDCRRLRLFSGRSKLSTWIKVCAVNLTLDHLRRQRPLLSLDELIETGEPELHPLHKEVEDPETLVGRSESVRRVRELLGTLPTRDRLLVERIYRDEVSGEQLAAELGTTVGAVYARKHRLHRRLVELFG